MSDAEIPTDSDQEFMEELKQEFKETIVINLKEMDKLFNANGFDEIAKIAHDIKGTSGIFGLEEGTEIAKLLQSAAQEHDAEKTKELLEQLNQYMKESGLID